MADGARASTSHTAAAGGVTLLLVADGADQAGEVSAAALVPAEDVVPAIRLIVALSPQPILERLGTHAGVAPAAPDQGGRTTPVLVADVHLDEVIFFTAEGTGICRVVFGVDAVVWHGQAPCC